MSSETGGGGVQGGQETISSLRGSLTRLEHDLRVTLRERDDFKFKYEQAVKDSQSLV